MSFFDFRSSFAYEHGLVKKERMTLETRSGIKELLLHVEDGEVISVTVDMGQPVLEPAKIPVAMEGVQAVDRPLESGGVTYRVTCVSMGNPHAVIFVDDVAGLELTKIGPGLEHHPLFPDRINTEFVRPVGARELEMRVWERGSGETMACGTGACAAVVAAVLNGYCRRDEDVTVHLRGGDLVIRWRGDGKVQMTGPATEVFRGEIAL